MATLSKISRACRFQPTGLWTPTRRHLSSNSKFFQVSEEVQQAVSEKRPVVALETTIYTHGYPCPENLALAASLEKLVRENGGVPATIGVLNGVARVGLSSGELERLISSSRSDLIKISRRDIAFALGLPGVDSEALSGGTTISGTMVLAHLAGIKVFATGGLGGVHRDGQNTLDISADLTELGRTPVTVISSGCKAFLDLPLTLEYLETQGVAVATFADGRPYNASRKIDFPAFYTRDSGVHSPMVLENEKQAADVIFAAHALGLQSGMHFANPIPKEHSLPLAEVQRACNEAVAEAAQHNKTGNAATPYILSKLKELSGGKTLAANTALVEANVIRGTKVAVELAKLEASEAMKGAKPPIEASSVIVGPAASNYTTQGVTKGLDSNSAKSTTIKPPKEQQQQSLSTPSIFVAGSLAMDLSCDFTPLPIYDATGKMRLDDGRQKTRTPTLQTSNPAQITQSIGGVGHNVALAAHLMGADVHLCSAVGPDVAGKTALESLIASGMETSGVATLPGRNTAKYVAVNALDKDLVVGMADMNIFSQKDEVLEKTCFENLWLPQLRESKPSHVIVDANWSPEYLLRWFNAAREVSAHVTYEPVSTAKAGSMFRVPDQPLAVQVEQPSCAVFPDHKVDIATPNIHELKAMHIDAQERGCFGRKDWWLVIDSLGIPSSGIGIKMTMEVGSKLVNEGIPQMAIQLLPHIPTILIKLGKEGVLLVQLLRAEDARLENEREEQQYIMARCSNGNPEIGGLYIRRFGPAEVMDKSEVLSVNGAGDTFCGALIAGLAKRGAEARAMEERVETGVGSRADMFDSTRREEGSRVVEMVNLAQRAAVLSLRSTEAVNPNLRRILGPAL